MRRRDVLIIGGAVAAALALPPILRRQDRAFAFEEMPGLPGFRRLVQGRLSGAPDMFAGLRTPEEIAADARLPQSLCRAIFPSPVRPDHLPIAVFSDYYCPFCAALDQRLADMAASGTEIDLVFHELPLLGDRSVAAARVALAAARQGDHTAIHLYMMQRVLRPGPAGIRDVAERHGLDAAQLMQDVRSPDIDRKLADALALGRALGIPGTPGMVIGRTIVIGALPKSTLEQLIALEQRNAFGGCA